MVPEFGVMIKSLKQCYNVCKETIVQFYATFITQPPSFLQKDKPKGESGKTCINLKQFLGFIFSTFSKIKSSISWNHW